MFNKKGPKEQRFIRTYEQTSGLVLSYRIIVDTQTGVNYMQSFEGAGISITPLLNADGKPIVTPISTLENM